MERLVINVPEKQSALVKQMLKDMGVTIQQEKHISASAYKKKIASVSVWTDDDLKVFEESKNAFNNFKPEQW